MKKNALIKFLASGFYTGYSSLIPGTTGTVPAWLLAYFLLKGNMPTLGIVAAAMIALSVFLATVAEPVLGHDSKKIVVDEWAGMFIALLFVPYSLTNYIIAFVAFRGFDAIKIFPAGIVEKLPGGWGVTADDMVAGIQANLLTQVTVYITKTVG
ncbi:MAG: phosphatidylglycerophosphatase A [Candidatus Zixiibacteriota bacterium]|nr:MAG: phosphatidylglycerophosphatase A [candidate division Zixibacteria bacterium]